ncbi:MAG: histidine triad nucleotide-binding protein [Patescibacteria group bacterium]|nr:histidine triad nucleotide-binding protein [Patescibacteria group bacterium]
MPEKTVFARIIDREIPADIVYEDEDCLAFRDIAPQAPTHVVLIPKEPIPTLDDFVESDRALAGSLLLAAGKVAQTLGIDGGYRVVINCGPAAGQEVMHVHLHILAGRSFGWPPG